MAEVVASSHINYGLKEMFRFKSWPDGIGYTLVGWEQSGKKTIAKLKSQTVTPNIEGDIPLEVEFGKGKNEPWAADATKAFIRNEATTIYFVQNGGEDIFQFANEKLKQEVIQLKQDLRQAQKILANYNATLDDKVRHRVEDLKDAREKQPMQNPFNS